MNRRIEVVEIEGEDVSDVGAPPRVARRWIWKPIPLTLAMGGLITTSYAAFQRVGTRANASAIEFTTNLSGGFLAVGMTDDEPGFLLLSALDREQVEVSAELTTSLAAGLRTFVELRTLREHKRVRLSDPVAILVNQDGSMSIHPLAWGLEDFMEIRVATDCSHDHGRGRHRCGVPFADFGDLVTAGTVKDAPDAVRKFLATRQRQ